MFDHMWQIERFVFEHPWQIEHFVLDHLWQIEHFVFDHPWQIEHHSIPGTLSSKNMTTIYTYTNSSCRH